MCGLVGIVRMSGRSPHSEIRWTALHMIQAIRFRGPDDVDSWSSEDQAVAFGHARLSIIDLSSAGSQPMTSASGKHVIAFNGEIYNHQAIRKALSEYSIAWRGHSDTEILVEALEHWGLDRTLREAKGMFAFALYDTANKKLHLARDRMGEKPLYYGLVGNTFVFASQLAAFRMHPEWVGEIEPDSVAKLLRHSFVPAPLSIYKQVWKLCPGSILSIDTPLPAGAPLVPRTYWTLPLADRVKSGAAAKSAATSWVDRLDRELRSVVRDELVSDVPVGLFLSGGIDSSLLAALASLEVGDRLKTFSIGFEDTSFDEAVYARQIAEHLRTDHCQLYVTPAETLAVVNELPSIYDEPFADASQIPTYLLCRLARREVTVALSGDGGDEMFGGYTRHIWADVLQGALRAIPTPARAAVGALLSRMSAGTADSAYAALEPLIPARLRQSAISYKLAKLGAILNTPSPHELHQALITHWMGAANAVRGATREGGIVAYAEDRAQLHHAAEALMRSDAAIYLPDDILVKVDRASMYCSLEARAPYLHPDISDLSFQMPIGLKIRGRKGKWVLRELLSRYVPRVMFERPKQGFGVPIRDWLRGPLRQWAEALLDKDRLEREGVLVAEPIVEKWREHVSGQRNWEYMLWNVLMFQQWLEATRRA